MSRKVPMRTCVITKEQKPKKEMVRIVRLKDQVVQIDPSGKMNGRGAYVSLDVETVNQARQNKALNRALNVEVPEQFYDELYDYVDYQIARKELLKQNER